MTTATPGAPQWVADLMDTLGAPGAGLAIALENLFPPPPCSGPRPARSSVKVTDIEKTEAWFLRHGTKATFIAVRIIRPARKRPKGARGCIDMRLRRDGGPPARAKPRVGERQATTAPHQPNNP